MKGERGNKTKAADDPGCVKAARLVWSYFDEKGRYMRRAFADAIPYGPKGTGAFAEDERQMIGILRRLVAGEELQPLTGAEARFSTDGGGMDVLLSTMGDALASVPGAWDEFMDEGPGRG